MANPLSAMLDELMGRNRNAMPSEDKKEMTWADPEVCPYFVAGYCPHELFVNTKADLGICDKIHDEKLREQYRKSDKFEKTSLEDEFLDYLQRINNDMRRKIDRNKQRLELTQPGGEIQDADKEKILEKLMHLNEKITALLSQAEQLGAKGEVEEAQGVVKMMEELTEERDRLQKNLDTPLNEMKSMEVCDTCGCFLILGDAQHRLDEHFTGKQHTGFAKIRATIEELIRKKEERRKLRDEILKKEREEREKLRSQEKDRHHGSRHSSSRRSRSRSKRRSRSRDRSKKTTSSSHHHTSSSSTSHKKDSSSSKDPKKDDKKSEKDHHKSSSKKRSPSKNDHKSSTSSSRHGESKSRRSRDRSRDRKKHDDDDGKTRDHNKSRDDTKEKDRKHKRSHKSPERKNSKSKEPSNDNLAKSQNSKSKSSTDKLANSNNIHNTTTDLNTTESVLDTSIISSEEQTNDKEMLNI